MMTLYLKPQLKDFTSFRMSLYSGMNKVHALHTQEESLLALSTLLEKVANGTEGFAITVQPLQASQHTQFFCVF